MEFGAGPGGEEAKIWAADLLRMYSRYAVICGYKIDQLDDTVLRVQRTGCIYPTAIRSRNSPSSREFHRRKNTVEFIPLPPL